MVADCDGAIIASTLYCAELQKNKEGEKAEGRAMLGVQITRP
jgi:hypothetical protein